MQIQIKIHTVYTAPLSGYPDCLDAFRVFFEVAIYIQQYGILSSELDVLGVFRFTKIHEILA